MWDDMQEKRLDVTLQEKLVLDQKDQEQEILNVFDWPNVDHVGDAVDLSRFADATFTEVYASHGRRIVEH